MRILTDIRLLARGGVSGIEEYTRNLLSELLIIDHNNEYTLFYNGLKKQPLNIQLSASRARFQMAEWKIPNRVLDFSFRFFRWPKIDRLIKTDLIFSPHFNILAVKNTPRIMTFHDLSFLHHPYFFSWKQKFWHWLQDIKKQAEQADKIIAVSEFTKKDLMESFKLPSEKIQVIYSGISEEFRPLGNNGANDARLNFPYILYLGTLEPRKNITALIKAFNILKSQSDFQNWKLVLAGRRGWLYENILKEAAGSPFGKDIIFWGPVTPSEKIWLYSAAKVFAYPSFFEGFGFPPLEAQACGCPVVVACRAALKETLSDSAIFIDPWKIDELAGGIKKVAADGPLRDNMVKAGLENAKRFSWRKTAEKVLDLFNQYN